MAINPLQPPVNYMAMMPRVNIGQEFAELGQALAQRKERQQAEELRQQYALDLQNAINNPTQATWAQMIAKYPKQREAFGDAAKMYGQERIDNEFKLGSRISTALENNAPEVAMAELKTALEGYKTSGMPAGTFKQVHDFLEAGNIQAAQAATNFALSGLDPDRFKKMADANSAVQAERRAAALQPSALKKAESEAEKAKVEADFAERLQQAGLDEKNWNVKNLQSQIGDRSARLNLDRQTTAATVAEKMASAQEKLTSIPEAAQKLVNESATLAASSKQAASQYSDLAKQLDQLGGSWGALNTAGEWTKSAFGTQDLRTALQNEYTRLANSAGIKAYKAAGATGGFSDADLNTALAGIPKSTANPKIMAQFMRGMAKAQEIDAAVNNAKTDWLVSNRGQLGRASSAFKVGDMTVNPGEAYSDFAQRAAEDAAKKFQVEQSTTPIIVTTPNGQVFKFKDQKSADDFKKAAGL